MTAKKKKAAPTAATPAEVETLEGPLPVESTATAFPIVGIGASAGGLAAFFWALKARQFEDPEGDSRRILNPDYDDHPKG